MLCLFIVYWYLICMIDLHKEFIPHMLIYLMNVFVIFCLRDQFICHSCQWISYICCVLNPTIIVSHLYIVIVNIRNSEWWSISKIHPNLTVELVKRLGDDISKEMANWFINYRNITYMQLYSPLHHIKLVFLW